MIHANIARIYMLFAAYVDFGLLVFFLICGWHHIDEECEKITERKSDKRHELELVGCNLILECHAHYLNENFRTPTYKNF